MSEIDSNDRRSHFNMLLILRVVFAGLSCSRLGAAITKKRQGKIDRSHDRFLRKAFHAGAVMSGPTTVGAFSRERAAL